MARLEEGEYIFGASGPAASRSWEGDHAADYFKSEAVSAAIREKKKASPAPAPAPSARAPAALRAAPPPATKPPLPPPPSVEKAPLLANSDAALQELCEHVDLAHLMSTELSSMALAELQTLGRAPLLARLKELGVAKLPERQKLAGAIAKAAIGAPVVAAKVNPFEADYVIIGGGMTGVGIAAELLDYRKSKSIIILDRLEKLGGHWLYAYPYVHLHNFTSYYTLFGYQWPEYIKKDLNHRASRDEIIDYFGTIQRVFESKPLLQMRFHVEVPTFKAGAFAGLDPMCRPIPTAHLACSPRGRWIETVLRAPQRPRVEATLSRSRTSRGRTPRPRRSLRRR